jgi:hypothetical protein
LPSPVKVITENPLVVLAETVELIEPSVLATPVPFAFQFHDAKVSPLEFESPALPKENPSLLKDVKVFTSVLSADVRLGYIFFVAPLITSKTTCSSILFLHLSQTQSG